MRIFKDTFQKSVQSHDGYLIRYDVSYVSHRDKVLFFVHGLGGDLTAWDKDRLIMKELGYSTIAMDLRGHGFSDRPVDEAAYSLDNLALDILDIVKAEHIHSFILVGHCFGGMVATVFAAKFSRLLKALIIIDIGYKPPFTSTNRVAISLIMALLKLLAACFPDKYIHQHQDFSKSHYANEWEVKDLVQNIVHTSFHSYLEIFHDALVVDNEHLLKKITAPTLIITGDEDKIIPPKIAKEIHHRIKHSSIEFIPHANHILVLNNPSELCVTMHLFLKKLKI